MTIQQILPKLKATSRTFKNIEYKMIVGYKKYYELAKDNQDYELHELDVRELTRILNLHTDDFSKKLCALSHLRAVLNHRISSNTRQESKITINQRVSVLEKKLGLVENTSYDNPVIKETTENDNRKYDLKLDKDFIKLEIKRLGKDKVQQIKSLRLDGAPYYTIAGIYNINSLVVREICKNIK